VKRFVIPCLTIVGLTTGYCLLAAPYRDRILGLFSLDYEIPVEVRKVEKSSPALTFIAQGELEPIKEVKALASVSGVVKEIRYVPGDRVAAGAVVAVIEAGDLARRLGIQEAAVKEAEAQLRSSESKLAAMEKQLGVLRDLYAKNFIARSEVEQAEAAVKTARVQKEATQAQLALRTSMSAQMRQVLGLSRITAPIGGVVTRRWLAPGTAVAEAAPIVSVAAVDALRLMIHLRRADADKVSPGAAVMIDAAVAPKKSFRGVVTQVNESGNFAGDELSVEIQVANPTGALKFGMPARVSFLTTDRRTGIFVPRSALIEDQSNSRVYVNDGGIARLRKIILGRRHNGEFEVLSGLQPGDVVVTRGAARLMDGSRVRMVE
jgi:RND family efflux transporter MFP subunit